MAKKFTTGTSRQLTPKQVARERKQIRNAGSSVSTERSITVGSKTKGFVNVPTIRFGKQFTSRQAAKIASRDKIQRPIFKTISEAKKAAIKRSGAIGQAIQRRKSIISKTLTRSKKK